MLKFKHKKTGNIIEVTQEIADQLIYPQGHYEEIKEEAPAEEVVVAPKKSKKKSKKKATKRSS